MILLISTIFYLLINVFLGFWASNKVKNTEDFVLAGRNLGLPMTATSIFATWFGAETIMSSSAEFAEGGLIAVIKEPFGAALCLFLSALLFVRPLYRLKMITLSDYFKIRYSEITEIISAFIMSISYFSWVAAQMIAMGTILSVLAAGAGFELSMSLSICSGAVLVCFYTMIGGMWAVSMTDFLQSIVIVIGLLLLSFLLITEVGGLDYLLSKQESGFFKMLPNGDSQSIISYGEAWILVGLGSIASPDIFQRTMSAKSEKIAVGAAYLSSLLYVFIAFLPLILGLCAKEIYPELLNTDDEKKQMLLVTTVLNHSPLIIQIMFFGALISAIMSTTSGAILAPATVLVENIVKPFYKTIIDKTELFILRISVILVAFLSLLIALGGDSIYDLAADSSAMTLVTLFFPLFLGLYWKKSSTPAALASMIVGLLVWLSYDRIFLESNFPSAIVAAFSSLLTMIVFSIAFPDNRSENIKSS